MTVMPFFSRIASASSVVGPLAISRTMLALIFFILFRYRVFKRGRHHDVDWQGKDFVRRNFASIYDVFITDVADRTDAITSRNHSFLFFALLHHLDILDSFRHIDTAF